MKNIISISMAFIFVLSINSESKSDSLGLVSNGETDKHGYKHPDQNKSGNCISGSSDAITIENETNYPIYYDISPRDDNGGKRLVDWRVEPSSGWCHPSRGDMIVEFDYLIAQAGVQAKSFAVKPGFTYNLVQVGEGVLDLKKK